MEDVFQLLQCIQQSLSQTFVSVRNMLILILLSLFSNH